MKNVNPDKIIIGRFGAVYGIKGWIHVNSYTDPVENILSYSGWQIQQNNDWQPITIESSNFHGNGIIAKFKGINDRDGARQYTNALIAVKREQLPLLNKSEFYWTDLFGLNVTTTAGVQLGKVVDIMETGSNDVFVVQDATQQRLIPYTDQAISAIDLANKMMVVDWDPEF